MKLSATTAALVFATSLCAIAAPAKRNSQLTGMCAGWTTLRLHSPRATTHVLKEAQNHKEAVAFFNKYLLYLSRWPKNDDTGFQNAISAGAAACEQAGFDVQDLLLGGND